MTDARLIGSTHEAAWLPPGSSAEVWVGEDCGIEGPVIVARVLLVRRKHHGAQELFCVSTAKGPNLPTRYLSSGGNRESLDEGLGRLLWDIFATTDVATRCIGFIRNVVPVPDATYAYPTPWAHVPVFLVTDALQPAIEGRWFGADQARTEAGHQHWWPIVEDYFRR